MQYLPADTSDDLKPGYRTFCLQRNNQRINFFAYLGEDTRFSASLARFFFRKGFSSSLAQNQDILSPIYCDEKGKEIDHESIYEVTGKKIFTTFRPSIDGRPPLPVYVNEKGEKVDIKALEEEKQRLLRDKFVLSGFRFRPETTEEQKQQAFKNLVDIFVETSKNADLESEKNLFFVGFKGRIAAYNNGGSPDLHITGEDIRQRLGIPPTNRLRLKNDGLTM